MTLLNGAAGRVGKNVFTVEDVRFFYNLLRWKDGSSTSIQNPPDREALYQAAQKLVFEEMILAEMRSLKMEGGNRSTAEQQVKELKKKVGESTWNDLLARYKKTETSVLNQIQRALDVEKFLEKKVETLTPEVTPAEAENYYKQNAEKFGGGSFESMKSVVMRTLQKNQMEKGLHEWITSLRDTHGVANLVER